MASRRRNRKTITIRLSDAEFEHLKEQSLQNKTSIQIYSKARLLSFDFEEQYKNLLKLESMNLKLQILKNKLTEVLNYEQH